MAELSFHPAHPPLGVRSIEARILGFDTKWLQLRWILRGAERVVVPPFAGKGRADGLWQTTCFEMFVQPAGEAEGAGYAEFNFSPSERWNAYAFSAPREDMRERALARDAVCTWRGGSDMAIFDAAVPASGLPLPPWRCGFTAVIEEEGGIRSYWALAHGSPAPDFHDPSCFVQEVAAPSGA
ncbi:DOMON-like domain-containing protein [Novosphingobium soli]|uniref:DOMON-like domain-containing protein n=1 Tax=Novosphingobium soli TaxID=574956 RepID=A0ABV6CQX8_9SPHN